MGLTQIQLATALIHQTEVVLRLGKPVVSCQPNDATTAHMGEISAETMRFRGVRGYIVDGGCRDSDYIIRFGFKVFCRYFTPHDIVGRWLPETFGEPIDIGGVTIATGDYVLGDRDGIVIIPGDLAESVIEETSELSSDTVFGVSTLKSRYSIPATIRLTFQRGLGAFFRSEDATKGT